LGSLVNLLRQARTTAKRSLGIEPRVSIETDVPLEFHGNGYCGWKIPSNTVDAGAVVVDVGLGEDIAFSESLIRKYGCTVHGFDPTPRAIAYIEELAPRNFTLHRYGVSANGGPATFFLPNNEEFVSGSLLRAGHVGARSIDVVLVGIDEVFDIVGASRIDLLKIDIEGAEYGLIGSEAFRRCAPRIDMLCVEFHHRWPEFGPDSTRRAVEELRATGFRCAWRSPYTNEEFLFLNRAA
jgi:FkbM family methyltransferase